MIRDDILKLAENTPKLPRIMPAIIKAIRKKIGEGLTGDCDMIEITLSWKKGESPKLVSKYVATKLKVDYIDDYIPEDFCYADTDSIKTEGQYRGGFTHTDSVKVGPDEEDH